MEGNTWHMNFEQLMEGQENLWYTPIKDLFLYLPVRYSPLWAHSFRSLSLSGVPGKGRPFLLSISSPMPNEAIPLPLPEQGNRTLNSEILKSVT